MPLRWQAKPTPQISQAIQSRIRPNGWVRVLVELKLPSRAVPEASLKNLTAVLAQRQIIGARREKLLAKLPPGTYRVLREYLTIPYVAMDVTTSSVAILADSASDVEAVLPDALARPDLADSGPLVQADQAWSVGYDGSGVAVGIVDTGVDATHPFLAGKVAAEACYSSTVAGVSESVCPNHLDEQHGTGAAAPCPFDDCFHGTHVAGVAAGDGRGAGQSFSGVARGATVLAVQAFSRVTDSNVCAGGAPCVAAFSSDILAALEHLYILSWELQDRRDQSEPWLEPAVRRVRRRTIQSDRRQPESRRHRHCCRVRKRRRNIGDRIARVRLVCGQRRVDHQGGPALGLLQRRAVAVAACAWRVDRVVAALRRVRCAEWHVDGRRSRQRRVRRHASGIAGC